MKDSIQAAGRDASVGDVMLDIVGIALAVILVRLNRQSRRK